MKKFFIVAGGTGGHILPAVHLARKLQSMPNTAVFLTGSGIHTTQLVNTFDLSLLPLPSPFFKNKKYIFRFFKGLWLLYSFLKSCFWISSHRPDYLISFGSIYSLSMLMAAKLLRCPIILHEANCLPGQVNRLFSRYAVFAGIYFQQASLHLNCPCQLITHERIFAPKKENSKQGKEKWGFDPNLPLVLICGGSLGAHFLNEICPQVLHSLKKEEMVFQVFHCTGNDTSKAIVMKKYRDAFIPAIVKSFEADMQSIYLAADFAICRSGAATIMELLSHFLPAILIPYPYAKEDHQAENARFFSDRVGGGIMIKQQEASFQMLLDKIRHWLQDNTSLAMLRSNLFSYRDTQDRMNFKDAIFTWMKNEGKRERDG